MNPEAALSFPATLAATDDLSVATSPAFDSSARFASDEVQNCGSDDLLLREAGEGSKQALSVLFRRHGRAVFNVAWRILRDEGEADDLRQETFLYLFQKAHLYDPQKSSASSWIIQIAYHRAIDRKRFLCSREHYRSQELEDQRIGSLFARPSTDHIDGQAILARMRAELTLDQQKTLEKHFFEGYTFQEIAAECGQSVGNVRHHYYRALNRLRASLISKKHG